VDDKTIRGSQAKGIPLREFTDFYVKAFFEDIAILNIDAADVYPRATDHVSEMVSIIKTLQAKGVAYIGEDGSVYYAVSKFPNYGKLSHLEIGELKVGARVNQDEYTKEDAQDFALWKAYTSEDGDAFWETELGKGRPGWHIECSAMSMKYLGETFDIHCGGIDNMFPHHENEIAQSEAATGKVFVNYWMHNEHLQVEGKKMSKSLGNFYSLRDLLEKGYDPMSVRYLLLSTHYRQQFNFTLEGLNAAKNAIDRLKNLIRRLQNNNINNDCNHDGKVDLQIQHVKQRFEDAMNNDLNISIALASLFDFVREINNLLDANLVNKEEATKVIDILAQFNAVLGIINTVKTEEPLSSDIDDLVQKRETARKNKNWKEADSIRDQLYALDIIIEDTAQGVIWHKKEV
ncbi:MAG: cysteine--tRNA ligase, partial [Nitrososphaerota archaeon]|nr:cysteine--tRNA ligase [Nitrososphaerota archaeon]